MATAGYELCLEDLAAMVALNDLWSWATEPKTQNALAAVQKALLYSVASYMRAKTGVELYRTDMWSCSSCRATPILALVEDPANRVVLQKCPKCKRVERATLTLEDLDNLRLKGVPLDDLGRARVKQQKKRPAIA
jgi:hypothetical protein